MISYWKTQSVRLFIAAANLIVAIVNFATGDEIWGVAWMVSFAIWALMSFIDYNSERLDLLEKKAEKYDALVDKVDALQKLLETEGAYSELLNSKIQNLAYTVEELRKK